jgi:methylated-DNA-[protein]-cysteine S-methyltransferase
MTTSHWIVINCVAGKLMLMAQGDQITHCDWTTQTVNTTHISPILQQAVTQLTDYFDGIRKTFDLPLAPQGTTFQQAVWRQLQNIPYGTTWSYQQLASAVGNAKASRAVGSANGKNPISIIIPCHRVIRAGGQLGGYAGGLDKKEILLALEQRSVD